jgi:serine/threonine protein kinase
VLIDFGHANPLDASEPSYGCYLYMPPESCSGFVGWNGAAVDKWSLGCVLIECVTGNSFYPKSLQCRNSVSPLVILHMYEKRLSSKLPHDLLRHFEMKVHVHGSSKGKGTSTIVGSQGRIRNYKRVCGSSWSIPLQCLVLKHLPENHEFREIDHDEFPLSKCFRTRDYRKYEERFLESINSLLNLEPKDRGFVGYLAVEIPQVQELQAEEAAPLDQAQVLVLVVPPTLQVEPQPLESDLELPVVPVTTSVEEEIQESPMKTMTYAILQELVMIIPYSNNKEVAASRRLFFDYVSTWINDYVREDVDITPRLIAKLALLNRKANFQTLKEKYLERLVRTEMNKRKLITNPLKKQRLE